MLKTLAFLTIIINEKSSIHWKRILALQLGVNTAHEIIDNSINIRDSIRKLKDTQASYSNYLKELDSIVTTVSNKNLKDVEKGRNILLFLEKIWQSKNKHDSHFDEKIKDITLLLSYLSNSNIQQFITELYLNQSIEVNLDNSIYLTTIHGSKGLEWDYVYIIDVDSENFPSIRQNYYVNEGDDSEEERRLFYVACSRAKQNLIITYNYCFNPSDKNYMNMSPLIREINPELYTAINMKYDHYPMCGYIAQDVSNYLKYIGYSKIYPFLKEMDIKKDVLHSAYEIPRYLDKFKYSKGIINSFINLLIAKMIQINFTKNIKKFDLNIESLPQKIRQNYKDELNDWRNILEDLFQISTLDVKDDGNIFPDLKNLLINPQIYEHYDKISKSLINHIKLLKPKEIYSRYNVSHADIKGEIDLLVDDTIIEFRMNQNEIGSTFNISQTLIYGYLLHKKTRKINNIILYNPLSGDIVKINTSEVKFKDVATMYYSHYKKN